MGCLFFEDIKFRIHTFLAPTLVDGAEVLFRFGLFSFVAGFLDPGGEQIAVTFKFLGELRIVCEVFDLMRIFLHIVEFFRRPLSKKSLFGNLTKLTVGMEFAQALRLGLTITILSLEKNTISEEVPEVAKLFGANGADPIDGEVATVTGGDNMITFLEVLTKEILAVEIFGKFNSR